MLRNMKVLLSVVVTALCFGLGSSALASDGFERDRFFDREDLVEELVLRERLFGRPFGLLQFGFGRVGLDLFLIEELLEDRFDRDEDFDRDRFDFDRDRFDRFDRDRFDRFDRDRFDRFDRDRFDRFDRDRDDRD